MHYNTFVVRVVVVVVVELVRAAPGASLMAEVEEIVAISVSSNLNVTGVLRNIPHVQLI